MTPFFRADRVHVQVPATSANLGPGFDALGLALDLVDDLHARVVDSGLCVKVSGPGEELPRDEKHLVVRAMRAAFAHLGRQPDGLELSCTNRIPHGRGLGSSAAAIVGGVLLARGLVPGGDELLPDAQALALASELEGHPDNVAPALLGGLTVAWLDEGRAHAIRLDCDARVRPVVFVPPFEASTEQARGLLPASVPHADAAANAARAALLVAALTGAPEHLLAATGDLLHQQYREPAMPASAALVAALRGDGLPAVVSGAGPTVLVLARDAAEVDRARGFAPADWRVEELAVLARGGHVVA
ncbi:MAG TPA: homoserine kinase [Jatrophihabitantaceae bacterium]|nr:homoserine kinase [Jatrophihabitantaceae bacterium]